MKKLIPIVLIATVHLIATSATKFCSPIQTPFNELLDKFNPEYHSAVEGYFVSENTFKVTYSYDSAIKTEKTYNVFEYGPFGSSCEMYEMGSRADSKIQGVKNSRLLILNKSRSKDGKLVTPIFYGEGVSAAGKKVTFDRYVADKTSNSKLLRFSTPLSAVRNCLQQKNTAVNIKWKTEVLKQYRH